MSLPALISSRAVRVRVAGLALLFALPPLPLALAEDPAGLAAVERGVCQLYDQAKDAVVKVHGAREWQLGARSATPVHRVGTGFFVSADGVALTSATVVQDTDSWWIEWEDERVPAVLVGQCRRVNLAVLRIDRRTPALKLAANNDGLRVGSMVVAIGFPYDLPLEPALGFVSGFDIRRGGHVFATTHLRTSCRLRPGQAGGPLLNPDGAVVGIAVAAYFDDDSYALPAPSIQRILTDILAHGAPQLGWAGLDVSERARREPAAGLRDTELVVREVLPGSPAQAAGFQPGDELLKVQDHQVRGLADVLDQMFHCRGGEVLEFAVRRGDQQELLSLLVATRPTGASPTEPARPAPLVLQPVAQEQ